MSVTPSMSGKKETRHSYISKPQTLYPSLEPKGRRIVFGFSYVQNINKGANTQVWFPPTLEESVGERLLNGDQSILDEFRVEWAAVRQFELLQEASNAEILPMEVSNMRMAFKMLRKYMRSGGLRVTVITMGRYEHPGDYDELQIMDQRLQDSIAEFISMLFLEEQSAITSDEFSHILEAKQWNFAEALPHVAMTLGAGQLFKPTKSSLAEKRFFQLLELLPQDQIMHDVAVGLQIPEFSSRHQWIYLPPSEAKYFEFQRALTTIFRDFDDLSIHELNERAGKAPDKNMRTIGHMRGYGDHMNADRRQHMVDSALFARNVIHNRNDAA